MPQPPAEYQDDLIIAVKRPEETEWTVKAYDPNLKRRQQTSAARIRSHTRGAAVADDR